jgi:PTH1 family peptidyl-tRNA hydrolase
VTEPVLLIVGLANPGREYEDTRHNAGAWFVNALARNQGVSLSEDKKYFGATGSFTFEDNQVRLLIPSTYMNRSGQATSALANFFKIPTKQILVAHDELDLAPGTARLKVGGGHGGHNGLRDIVSSHGNQNNFIRLRVGIGHPGNAALVTPHVLSKPSSADRDKIDRAIDEALSYSADILRGDISLAMNSLNAFKA